MGFDKKAELSLHLLISSILAWKPVLAAFMLLITSPTFPTTAANTNTPLKKVSPRQKNNFLSRNSIVASSIYSSPNLHIIKDKNLICTV